MNISNHDFMAKFTELYASQTPYIATLAFWKMKHLIEDGECFYLPEYDCYYMIRQKHLLVYYAPDNLCHIPMAELNALDCISLPADMFDAIKPQLVGFNESRSWSLRYDFSYTPPLHTTHPFEAVSFDFNDQQHYEQAAILINGGEEWLKDTNIRKMTIYSAFDPSLWFFVRDKTTQDLVAISISAYCEEARQTDLDWIFVSPQYQGKGAGRFLIEETIRRCKDKSDSICVGGTVEFYRKCGFYDYELWVWARKEGYEFTAPCIQP